MKSGVVSTQCPGLRCASSRLHSASRRIPLNLNLHMPLYSFSVSAYSRLTRFFLRLVQNANDFCGGSGEPVENHKRILADDKLPVWCGFQLASDFRVVGYLQNSFADLMPDSRGDGWGCFDVIFGDAPQVAVGG